MHGPPAVAYRFTRSPQPANLLVLVGCLTVFILGLLWAHTSVRVWIPLALLALTVNAVAWRQWWRSPEGVLLWDGDQWHWSAWLLSPVCSIQWVFVFQTWGLVKIGNDKRQSAWLWLHEGSNNHERSLALRRALLATRGLVNGLNQSNEAAAPSQSF